MKYIILKKCQLITRVFKDVLQSGAGYFLNCHKLHMHLTVPRSPIPSAPWRGGDAIGRPLAQPIQGT